VGDVLEADIEKESDVHVVERVVDVAPLSAIANESMRAEKTHVVTHRSLREAADRGEITDAKLTGLQEGRDQPHPARIGQHPKRLGQIVEDLLLGQTFEDGSNTLGVYALDLAQIGRCDRRPHQRLRYLHSHEDNISPMG
jgi:hypothetical protein